MIDIDSDIIKSGSSDNSFKQIYDYYSPYIWRLVYRMVNGNHEIAKETLQTIFIRVHKSINKFTFKSSFSTWLYKIAWREAIRANNRYKKQLLRERPFDESYYGVDNSIQEKISEILESLDIWDRFIIVTREVEGFSYREISEITGKSEVSLRTSVSRIKDKIRRGYYE